MAHHLALFGGPPVRTRPFTAWPVFGAEEEARLLRVLRSGNWGRLDGAEVSEFEGRFAAMHGCKHGIAVANGTVALRIALLAAGIRAEDEVIVPPYTFVSTASAAIEANAIPIFADIDLNTFNLDPSEAEAAITPRTRAIIPVHFAGQPAEMNRIMVIARERNLIVIEDAAHAHGAAYEGRPAGSIGHLATFSFQSSKNLTAGEGGIITTNDDALAKACRSIQNCGRVPEGLWYEHHVISGNYRLTEFQGAVLNCQLERLEDQTRTRDAHGTHLASHLAKIPGIYPQARPAECSRHSYHLFMLRLDAAAFGAPRAAVLSALQAEGIPCSGGYGFSLPVPYILNALILTAGTYLLMHWNAIHKPFVNVPWTTPPIVGHYLVSGGDWRAAVWGAASIVIAAAVYFPFARAAERQRLPSRNSLSVTGGRGTSAAAP